MPVTIYLHCAPEGLKLDLIKKDSRIGFEADCSHNIIEGDNACNYMMEYESVIGCGVSVFVCVSRYHGCKKPPSAKQKD